MTQLLESVTHFASIAASVAVLLSPAAAAGLGVLPRAGPMRAFVLGISTKLPFMRPACITSQRIVERNALSAAVKAQSMSQYVVVTGPKVCRPRGCA